MPNSIKVALVSAGYSVLYFIYIFLDSFGIGLFKSSKFDGFGGLYGNVCLILMFWGITKRNRMAWFLGRSFGILGIIFFIPIIILFYQHELNDLRLIKSALPVLMWVILSDKGTKVVEDKG